MQVLLIELIDWLMNASITNQINWFLNECIITN